MSMKMSFIVVESNSTPNVLITSGQNPTIESLVGFPSVFARASLAHARRDFHHGLAGRAPAPSSPHQGPQRCAEARLASPDRVADGRGARHQRDHAAERQVEDLRLALAATLHGGGLREPVARQDATLAHSAARN